MEKFISPDLYFYNPGACGQAREKNPSFSMQVTAFVYLDISLIARLMAFWQRRFLTVDHNGTLDDYSDEDIFTLQQCSGR